MKKLFALFLSKLEPVHVARSAEEREAIYRFRYEIYIEELHKPMADADHEHRWLRDRLDEDEATTLLYTGSPAEITSTIRLRAWEAGRVPADEARELSMELVPGIETLRVAEIGRLMIRPGLRGKMLLPALLRRSFEILATEAHTDIAFMFCLPGLIRHYRTLGARPFGGRIIQDDTGPSVPLLAVLSDYRNFRRCGSFLAPLCKRYYGPGGNRVLDPDRFRDLLEGGGVNIEFDRESIWSEVQERISGAPERPAILEGLSDSAVRRVLGSGFVLEVGAEEAIVREGIVDREVYVIFEGKYEVIAGGRQVAVLGPGDVFGEIAFFSSLGRRTAHVKSLTKGRLLVLRRRFLKELTREDPEAGFRLTMNLSRVAADRFTESLASAYGQDTER